MHILNSMLLISNCIMLNLVDTMRMVKIGQCYLCLSLRDGGPTKPNPIGNFGEVACQMGLVPYKVSTSSPLA